MTNSSKRMRGHSPAYPRGHGHSGSSMDGRLAYDIVEAAGAIFGEAARLRRVSQELRKKERHIKKVAAITLAIAPWE